MTRDFVDGKLDYLHYTLNYDHELAKRWKSMDCEHAAYADMVHYYLFEEGFDLYNNLDEKQLRKKMKRQYDELMAAVHSDIR